MKLRIPYIAAIIPVLFTVTFLILAVFVFNIPLFIPLFIGYALTVGISLFYRIRLFDLWQATIKGIQSISMIFLILLLIGVLIAIWSSSGTLDALVYYGLAMIHPSYIVVISFIVSSIVSMLLGTSVGTASTIGVAFMGMAHSLGANPALIAGAIVSGAFVGDRTSPLSSAAHVNAVVTETHYYENIKGLLKTLLPTMAITAIIYFFVEQAVGRQTSASIEVVQQSRLQLLSLYEALPLWLLLPPLSIMVLSFFKISTYKNLAIGIIIGAILAYIFQGATIIHLFQYALFGYHHPSGSVFGGGWNMFHQVLLIIVAGAFHGVLEVSGILSTLLERMTATFVDRWSILLKTIEMSVISAVLFSTQIMGIIIPGKFMLKYYKEHHIDNKLLNRMISDSGMVVSGLIPWNLNAILLGIALNISVVDYLPYAYLLFLLPIYSYLLIKLEKARKVKSARRKMAKNYE